MKATIAQAQHSLAVASARLAMQLNGSQECVIWGAGEYLAKVIDMSIFEFVVVRHIFDRNPSLHGKQVRGVTVGPYVETDLPIVIASAVNSASIRRHIESLGITNQIIELEFQ